MMIQLIGVNGRNYSLVVNDLCGAIIPDQCFVKVCKCTHCTIDAWVNVYNNIIIGETWHCKYWSPEEIK